MFNPALARVAVQAATVSRSVPVDVLEAARLVVTGGASRMTVAVGTGPGELLAVRARGGGPELETTGGVITLRQAPRRWLRGRHQIDVGLHRRVPWAVDIAGGASRTTADLRDLRLRELSISGGASRVELTLPVPVGAVPIHIVGGAVDLTVRRPFGVGIRIVIDGGATRLRLDDLLLGAASEVRWACPDGDARDRYDVHVMGGAVGLAVVTWERPMLAPYREPWSDATGMPTVAGVSAG